MIPEIVYVVEVTGGIHFRYHGQMKYNEFDSLQQRWYIAFDTEEDAKDFVATGDEILNFVNEHAHYIKKP